MSAAAALTGSIVAIVVGATVSVALLLYRKELREPIGGIKQVRFKDFAADFDKTAGNALAAAAEKVWSRPNDRQEYLDDGPEARRLLSLAAIYDGASRTEAARMGLRGCPG